VDRPGGPQAQRYPKGDHRAYPAAHLCYPSFGNGPRHYEREGPLGTRRYTDHPYLPTCGTIGQAKAVQSAGQALWPIRMSCPDYEVAHVLERNREHLADHCANSWQVRILHALRKCRTAALGGHIDLCDNPGCHKLHLSYNSCRNRHCPKCQGHKKEEWIQAREADLLNVSYFHVVFTLPSELNRLCLYGPKMVYGLLFKTAWSIIRDFGGNPKFLGARMGMIAILHTWGQNLSLHPHLHCIVPGAGITKNDKWKHAKGKGKPGCRTARYLFPVKAMSKVFRARFVAGLRKELKGSKPPSFYESLFKNQWVVYCKRPFLGPS